MKSPILPLLALCFLATSWTGPVFGFQEPPTAPQAAPGARKEALERAFKLIEEGQFQPAKAEIERASAMAGGPCGECLLGLSHIYASEKKWEQAVEASRQAIPLLMSPGVQARAYNQLGIANVMRNTPESLTQAEEALRRAVEAGGAWGGIARYNLAEVLFRRQSWAEAAVAARGYLEAAGPDGTVVKEARVLLCRARTHLPDEPPPAGSGEIPEPKRVGGEVQRPEILSQVKKPVYTPEARRALTNGAVILEALIDEEGCVRNVKPLKEQPHGLTESAIEAVQSWVFLPVILEGRAVKVYYVLTVNFQVDVGSPPRLP
jgi:TonB family protein